MKKVLLFLVIVLATLSSCRKQAPVAEEGHAYALSSLRFDFSIDHLETKGIKSGWESGDKVFVFFSGVKTAFVTMSYDGSIWSSTPSNGEVSLNQTGQLTAIYLPYVGNVQPEYSDGWRFASGAESYFLKAEKVDYYIREMDNQPATVGAKLVMAKANDACAQFFVPKTPEQNETMQLACNVVKPTGLTSISSDGTVTSSGGSQGAWLTGYPATVGGEQGFYFYGMIADTPGSDNYFALRDNNGTYYKQYFKGNTTLLARRSYQLPAFNDSWSVAGSDVLVNVAGNQWYSLNDDASFPWDAGTATGTKPSAAGITLIPSSTAWSDLLDPQKTTRVSPFTIGGLSGVLMVDKSDPSQFFILLPGDYWSSTAGYFFRVASNGTCSVESGTPESAFVRRIKSVTGGSITDPEDGGDI